MCLLIISVCQLSACHVSRGGLSIMVLRYLKRSDLLDLIRGRRSDGPVLREENMDYRKVFEFPASIVDLNLVIQALVNHSR